MEKEKLTKDKVKSTFKVLMPYIVIILVVVLIRTFLMSPIKVNGTSMNDTLQNGDTMILNKLDVRISDIERFQIVVIKTSESYLIKRVIGLPGETIEYKEGKLYINGEVYKDPYFKDDNTSDFDKVKIPSGHYFVMGDNRSDSIDSRIIGVIDRKDIMGTTNLVIFPIKDIGIVK